MQLPPYSSTVLQKPQSAHWFAILDLVGKLLELVLIALIRVNRYLITSPKTKSYNSLLTEQEQGAETPVGIFNHLAFLRNTVWSHALCLMFSSHAVHILGSPPCGCSSNRNVCQKN